MIIGGDKAAVVENIKKLSKEGDLNHKAELDDPTLDEEGALSAIDKFNSDRAKKIKFFFWTCK